MINANTPLLTGREVSLLRLASKGCTDKAISEHLGLSKGTIESYWARIRLKLRTSSRTEAVAIYLAMYSEESVSNTGGSYQTEIKSIKCAIQQIHSIVQKCVGEDLNDPNEQTSKKALGELFGENVEAFWQMSMLNIFNRAPIALFCLKYPSLEVLYGNDVFGYMLNGCENTFEKLWCVNSEYEELLERLESDKQVDGMRCLWMNSSKRVHKGTVYCLLSSENSHILGMFVGETSWGTQMNSLSKAKDILDRCPIAAVIANDRGVVEYANSQYRNYLSLKQTPLAEVSVDLSNILCIVSVDLDDHKGIETTIDLWREMYQNESEPDSERQLGICVVASLTDTDDLGRATIIAIDMARADTKQIETSCYNPPADIIIDHANDAVYIYDLQGKLLFANDVMLGLLGCDYRTVLGKERKFLAGAEDPVEHRLTDLRVIADRRPLRFKEVMNVNGVETPYVTEKYPVYGSDGAIMGVLGVTGQRRFWINDDIDSVDLIEMQDFMRQPGIQKNWAG